MMRAAPAGRPSVAAGAERVRGAVEEAPRFGAGATWRRAKGQICRHGFSQNVERSQGHFGGYKPSGHLKGADVLFFAFWGPLSSSLYEFIFDEHGCGFSLLHFR